MASNRDSMQEELTARTESSYETRERGVKYPDVYQPDAGVQTWYCDKGEHEIDILPYQAGPNDPVVKDGKWAYMLDMHIHRNVGPRDLQFICLDRMYGEACPICKYRGELRKNAPEGEHALERHERKVKDLNPSRQVLYNAIVYDSREEEDKGVQLWQVAHYFMERVIAGRAKQPKSHGGGYVLFSHPSKEHGRSITFTVMHGKRPDGGKKVDFEHHQFHERNYSIHQDDLADCKTLDDLIHIPTYKEVEEAFWDEARPEGEEEEPRGRSRAARDTEPEDEEPRRKAKGPEDEEPRPKRRREPEEETEERPRRRAAAEGEEEPRSRRARNREDENEEPPPRRRGRNAEPEDEEPRPRGSRRSEPEDEEPPPRRTRNAELTVDEEGGEEEAPRPRRKAKEPEEEEPARPRKLSKVGDKALKCPVPGGTLGKDVQEYDECETCELWDPCVAASNKK